MDENWIKELRGHEFIVVGYEHYNPLGVIRSLGENGIRPVFIVLRNELQIASVSKYIKKLYIVEDNIEAFNLIISRYGNEKNKPFLIPCDDNINEIFDDKYNELKDHFYVSNCGTPGKLTYYQNKDATNSLAEKSGFIIPKSWIIRNKEIKDAIEYPVITKPLTSYPGWKSDYYVCDNEDQLKKALNKIDSQEILIQQFIKKKYETCMDGVAFNNGNGIFISNYSRSAYVLEDYYSLMNIHNNLEDDSLYMKVCTLFREVGYEGIFSVDFLVGEDNTRYFLEVNYRNSAYSYASTKLGMNLPLIWAFTALNHELPANAQRNVPKDYVSIAEVADFEHRVRRLKVINTAQWFKDVKSADCLLLWNNKDLKPGISVWKNKFSNFCLKSFKKIQ